MFYPFNVKLFGGSGHDLQLCVNFTTISDVAKKRFAEYIQRFTDLANCGALSGSGVSPVTSGIGQSSMSWKQGLLHTAICMFEDARVDLRAAFSLLNLIYHFHAHHKLVESVSLNMGGLGTSLNLDSPSFPTRSRQLSFALVWDEELGRRFDILVHFCTQQGISALQRADAEMGSWFAAASLGAYGDTDFLPPLSAIQYSDDPVQLGEVSITWQIDGAFCSDEAFFGLLNCLERVSGSFAPIKTVVIGA